MQILLGVVSLLVAFIFFKYLTYLYRIYLFKKLKIPIAHTQFFPLTLSRILKIETDKDVIVEYFKEHDVPLAATISSEYYSVQVRYVFLSNYQFS